MQVPTETLLSTVNVAELHSVRWGFMRQFFPRFADDLELGRYVRGLLASQPNVAVRVEPHRLPDGQTSPLLFDVYRIEPE